MSEHEQLMAEVQALRAEVATLRKLQPVAWSAIQAMREIERQVGGRQFEAAISTIQVYLATIGNAGGGSQDGDGSR